MEAGAVPLKGLVVSESLVPLSRQDHHWPTMYIFVDHWFSRNRKELFHASNWYTGNINIAFNLKTPFTILLILQGSYTDACVLPKPYQLLSIMWELESLPFAQFLCVLNCSDWHEGVGGSCLIFVRLVLSFTITYNELISTSRELMPLGLPFKHLKLLCLIQGLIQANNEWIPMPPRCRS